LGVSSCSQFIPFTRRSFHIVLSAGLETGYAVYGGGGPPLSPNEPRVGPCLHPLAVRLVDRRRRLKIIGRQHVDGILRTAIDAVRFGPLPSAPPSAVLGAVAALIPADLAAYAAIRLVVLHFVRPFRSVSPLLSPVPGQ